MSRPDPTPFSSQIVLRDGTSVKFRLVGPGDRARLLRGVGEMSRTTRYLRFFASTREMTDDQARCFTDIDQINHVAVCAVESDSADARDYGIARFVRDPASPRHAEFAIAVIDEMQARGLRTVLLAALYLRAQALGVEVLHSEPWPKPPCSSTGSHAWAPPCTRPLLPSIA